MNDKESCTGATGEHLAFFRLLKPDRLQYFAKEMTLEELSERRLYLRKVLEPFPRWKNLSNEELEDIRLCKANNGYILEDANGYEILLQSNKITPEVAEFRRIHAMMPFEFLNLTSKDFDWTKYSADMTEAKEMVNRYALQYEQFKSRGMGLYIYSGTKGSGKTMLSCCLINEITKRYSGSVKFVNILDFLEMTKKSYDGDPAEVNAIYKAELLVLDDIGVQMSKEWVDTVLYQLINRRYSERLPTIYTSNIPVERLKMDDRITDRIESTTYLVKLPEEPIRKNARQQDKQKLLDAIKSALR